MTSNEIIFHFMRKYGYTSDEMAEKLNLASRRSVNQTLNQQNMLISTLIRYLDAMGCEVVVRNKDGEEEVILDDNCEDKSPYRYDFPLDFDRYVEKEKETVYGK